jgi:hypothetical protein
LLAGSGNQVRHIRLENARPLDRPEAKALMNAAVAWAGDPYDAQPASATLVAERVVPS